MNIRLHVDGVFPFIDKGVQSNYAQIETAYKELVHKTGKGNDFLGWLDLPEEMAEKQILEIQKCATSIANHSEIVVVIGIGGSYLGARAVIDALQNPFKTFENSKTPHILYAGNSLSEDYHYNLLQLLDNKSYSILVISKSGTTTEPAIAFRILKAHCENKYGITDSKKRIVAITDGHKGALKQLADKNGYQTFVIPDDVGGRYSVLTPVGLLPIAIAGFDIQKLLLGAQTMRTKLLQHADFENNIAMQYAYYRNLLYKNQKKIELLVSYEPRLFFFIEWFKQLFGESEGKENKGIFPAGATFSTDLHSLGQYIQEGERHIFETVLSVQKSNQHVPIPFDTENLDGLNYLQTRSIQEINQIAEEGTREAHLSGEVPNIRIVVPEINEFVMGELIYFFEFSCALGCYMLDINPFDQPGVEAYKQNMFRLLGK